MSKRWLLLLAVLVVLAMAAAGALWYGQPQKTVVTLEITGPRGLAVKGTADVDGVQQELTGTLPTKFVLEGRRITYSLANTEDSGEVRAKAIIDDLATGSSTTGDPPKYRIRGWVQAQWWRSPPSHGIESFDPDADTGWRFPPP
jgi:hypothetical protein